MISSLQQKISEDLKSALKTGNQKMISTSRLLLAALHNREIEKRSKGGDIFLTDDDTLEVLNREAKKRKEAAELYLKNNREDLAQKEADERKLIEGYLPAEIKAEELEELVDKIINSSGDGKRDFGRIMARVMQRAMGRVDGKAAAELVKKRIFGAEHE